MKSPHASPPKGGARGRPQRIKGGGPPSDYSKKGGGGLGVCKVGQPSQECHLVHAKVEFLSPPKTG